MPDGAGGIIFIGTDHTGHGGNLTVQATESILISGQGSPDCSGLFTAATKGVGMVGSCSSPHLSCCARWGRHRR